MAVKRLGPASVLLSDDLTGGELEFKAMDGPRLRKASHIVLLNSAGAPGRAGNAGCAGIPSGLVTQA